MADARLTLSAALTAILLGCGGAGGGPSAPPGAAPAPAATAPRPSAEQQPELPSGPWSTLASHRHSLELVVPDRESWFVDDAATQWLVLRHDATRSEIVLRTWRAPRRVRREECEAQARLWRPAIPQSSTETTLEQRDIEAPIGFHTDLRVGVQPRAASGEILGFALAFGAATGRCFALIYTTIAAGVGADAAVGRRLATVTDAILPRVRFLAIDERVR